MDKRYTVISYCRPRHGATLWYKVVDTFNGLKVMRNGISNEQDAKDYADSLNDYQNRKETR